MRLFRLFKRVWESIPDEEKEDRRTRWILTIISFFLLSILILLSFGAAIFLKEYTDISLAMIDLAKHICYVLGGTVAAYYSYESFFPSSDRPYGGWGGGWGSYRKAENEPAAAPSENDAQVP